MADFQHCSDEYLQQLAQTGNREAEDVLAVRYVRMVRACARPFFLAGGDSEDLTQEGMLGLLSAIREYDVSQNTSFRTYAELCIKRRILSAIRSASRLKHAPLNEGISLESVLNDKEQAAKVFPSFDFRRMPEEHVLARERADEFFHTYSRCLSPLENQILSLFLEGLSYREISQICGRDVKAVDNAVQRIRRKLAREFTSGDFSSS